MATRPSLDDKLASLRRLRAGAIDAEQTAELKKALADKSNLVVAAAAEIAGTNALIELAKDLEAAFERLLGNPIKDDKLCRGKIAVVQALDKLEHPRSDVFEKAATYVQLEPVWGRSEDMAGPLRGAALIALARIDGSNSVPWLVDAMVDPLNEVRIAAARALGYVGTEAAGLVLRLKSRIGDSDPDVLSECLSGLLAVSAKDHLALVSGFLDTDDSARCEAAALALGKSRLADALEPLTACWPRCFSAGLRERILLAIAMLRLPAAIDHLIDIVGSHAENDALAAMTALKIHSYDPRLRQRLESVVRQTGRSALAARFDRDFPPGE